MAFEVRFPAVYERISAPRTDEEIERELNRRCGYPIREFEPVKSIDPDRDPRAGTKWERQGGQKPKPPRKKRSAPRVVDRLRPGKPAPVVLAKRASA
jgi:hypothetical protein